MKRVPLWLKPVYGFMFAVVSIPVLAQAGALEGGTWRFSTGFDYSSGDYGESVDTDITYLPFTARYEALPWTFKLTVPYIRIKGPGNVIGGGVDGSVVIRGGQTQVTTESGLGDIVASVGYELPVESDTTIYEVTGKVKLGTADETKRLGTGENDVSAQFDVITTYNQFTPFATAGYRSTGDPPNIDLENVFYFSLGTGYRLDDRRSVGAIYDFRESASRTSGDSQELVGYLTHRYDSPWSWLGYVSLGLSDNAPDQNIGMQWTYRYE